MTSERAHELIRGWLGRPLTDLRVSVTDRCNFRCRYCMPREHFDHGHRYLPRAEILSFEEITAWSGSLVPLRAEESTPHRQRAILRQDLPELVEMLARLQGSGSLL